MSHAREPAVAEANFTFVSASVSTCLRRRFVRRCRPALPRLALLHSARPLPSPQPLHGSAPGPRRARSTTPRTSFAHLCGAAIDFANGASTIGACPALPGNRPRSIQPGIASHWPAGERPHRVSVVVVDCEFAFEVGWHVHQDGPVGQADTDRVWTAQRRSL